MVEINPDLNAIPFTPRLDLHDVREALVLCGKPSRPMLPFAKSSGRLTDVTRYGGTHRLRFDSNGQGLGVAGRRDIREGQDFLNTDCILTTYHLEMSHSSDRILNLLTGICPCCGPSPPVTAS